MNLLWKRPHRHTQRCLTKALELKMEMNTQYLTTLLVKLLLWAQKHPLYFMILQPQSHAVLPPSLWSSRWSARPITCFALSPLPRFTLLCTSLRHSLALAAASLWAFPPQSKKAQHKKECHGVGPPAALPHHLLRVYCGRYGKEGRERFGWDQPALPNREDAPMGGMTGKP